jgi:hypothetical protein
MASDAETAKHIAEKNRPYADDSGVMISNVAKAVAEGIALGRKEGWDMAMRVIAAGVAKRRQAEHETEHPSKNAS